MVKRPRAGSKFPRFSRRALINLAIFILLLYVLLPQVSKFRNSLGLLGHLKVDWLLEALALSFATYLLASCIYWLLAKKYLRFGRTVLIQLAGMFDNRLVPAGIGNISVNYEYLRRNKHIKTEAVAVVAANNTMGLIGHLVLLSIIIAIFPSQIKHVNLPHISISVYLTGGLLVLAVLGIAWSKKLGSSIRKTITQVVRNLLGYRTHAFKAAAALACSMLLTACYSLCLLACARALGIHLDLAQALLVLTVGVAGGVIVPTPGGLGGAEAGLVAGLLAFGVKGPDALAATLLYRLLTYWLALILGSGAFVIVEHLNYI